MISSTMIHTSIASGMINKHKIAPHQHRLNASTNPCTSLIIAMIAAAKNAAAAMNITITYRVSATGVTSSFQPRM